MALHEVTGHDACLYAVHRTHRDGSSFTWHQQCNNQIAVSVHHCGGYGQERAIKSYSHSFRITCDKSTVSLLKSGE